MHIELDSLELHDALIESFLINYFDGAVTIKLSHYSSNSSKKRDVLEINFSGVSSTSHVCDLTRMRENSFGNVNYWSPSSSGTTFFYLVDGCIAITATAVSLKKLGIENSN